MLLFAYLFSVGARFFGLPRVVGQIMAGFFLGLPFLQPLLFTPENGPIFQFLADVGILLLFFFTGLEVDIRSFEKTAKESCSISFFNTVIPLTGGYFLSSLVFGFSSLVSLIIGISLAVSSQAISLDLLDESNMMKSKIGKLIISAGSIDDLFELFLVSILLVLFHINIEQVSLIRFFLNIFFFVIIVFVFKWWFVPLVLHVFEQEQSRSYLFMGSFILVLLMAWLSEQLGIGSLIGAFITGMLVRYTLLTGKKRKYWEEHEISRSVHTISFGFLIPLFFVWVGVNTQIVSIFAQTKYLFPLLLIDIGGTVFGTMIGVMLLGGTVREGVTVGWGVTPKGDTELIIATLALTGGLIDKKIYTLIVMIAFLTTVIAPVMFKYSLQKITTR